MYGGPGNDDFLDRFVERSSDVFVGGPGWDRVWLARDKHRDVVLFHGGGNDGIRCRPNPDPQDVLLIDRSDRVGPNCKNARVLYAEQP
jgi:hypothetical protein